MSYVECRLWWRMWRGLVLVMVLSVLVACAGRRARVPGWEEGVLKMGRFFELHRADDRLEAAVERGRRIFEEKGCGRCHPGGGTIGRTKEGGFPIPDLHGARDRYPKVMTPKRIVVTLGQMNDICATVFLNRPPMDPDSQEYVDLAAYVASLGLRSE